MVAGESTKGYVLSPVFDAAEAGEDHSGRGTELVHILVAEIAGHGTAAQVVGPAGIAVVAESIGEVAEEEAEDAAEEVVEVVGRSEWRLASPSGSSKP